MRTYTLATRHYTMRQRITSMFLSVAVLVTTIAVYRAFADGIDVAVVGDSRAYDLVQWLNMSGGSDTILGVSIDKIDDVTVNSYNYDYVYNNSGSVGFRSNSQSVFNNSSSGRSTDGTSTAPESHNNVTFYANAGDSYVCNSSNVEKQVTAAIDKVSDGGTIYCYYGSAYSVCNTTGSCDPVSYVDKVSELAKANSNINFVIVSATYIDEDRVGEGSTSQIPYAYKSDSYNNDAIDTFNYSLEQGVADARTNGATNLTYVDVNTSSFTASLTSDCYNADGIRYLRDTSVTCADGGNGHLEPTLYYYIWNAMQGYTSAMDSSDFIFDGWDNEDNQAYAWYVYDLTDWNEISGLQFSAAGATTLATVPDTYRNSLGMNLTDDNDYENSTNDILQGIKSSGGSGYSGTEIYAELLLAISYTLYKESGDNGKDTNDICNYYTYVAPKFSLKDSDTYSLETQTAYNEKVDAGYSLKSTSAKDLYNRLISLERKYYDLYNIKMDVYSPDNTMKVVLQALIYGEEYIVASGGQYSSSDAQAFYANNKTTNNTYIGLRETPEFDDFAEQVLSHYSAMAGFSDFENIGTQ